MTNQTGRSRRILVSHNQIAESAVRLLNDHDIDVFFSPPYDPPEVVAARVAELQVDAIMVRQGNINDQVIGASSRLKVIVKHGVGVDNIDIAAATARGIPVLRSMGSNARAVAEHAIALALMQIKQIQPLNTAVKAGEWPKPSFIGKDFQSAVIGLIGYGSIGRETARMADALGMEVVVHDPYSDAAVTDGYAVASDIDVMLPALDILSLHCPLTATTRNLIDGRRLALMKPAAVIVNTARGGIIDEEALAEALRNGIVAGAALDSFATEPPAANNPLWELPMLTATPHIGGVTRGSARSMAEIAARHIISVLDGNPPDERSLARASELSL